MATQIRTTDGTIALGNLQAQIESLELQAARGGLPGYGGAALVDRLTLRGQVLGWIADYERAAVLGEQLVCYADGLAFLTRARTRALLHRFDEALADLDVAERLGRASVEVEADRAAIFQAVGCYAEAMALRRAAVERRATFENLWALAALHADRGETAAAEELFDASRKRFRGVSPFGLAQLDFQRGHMWQEQGDFERARGWFMSAWCRLPAYAQAEGHLAEVEAALGARQTAIARLRRLAAGSDDPEYASQLSGVLAQARQLEEAGVWRAKAEVRYDELVARHPAAFADHAAEFWLTVGCDPQRALDLATRNFAVRQTSRASALVSRAVLARESGLSPDLA